MSLTAFQQQVVTFISVFTERYGRSPTHRELRTWLGKAGGISDVIDRLVRHGVITRKPGVARSLQIVQSESRKD
jgi:SOS-response transcriptional repressor LexA